MKAEQHRLSHGLTAEPCMCRVPCRCAGFGYKPGELMGQGVGSVVVEVKRLDE